MTPSSFRFLPVALVLGAALVLFSCSVAAVVTEPPPTTLPSQTPPAPSAQPSLEPGIAPVSASKPGPEAADVLSKCQVGKVGEGLPITLDMVSGMGKIPSAKDLTRYVPLTGREPELSAPGSAWAVQIRGDVLQPGSEIWTDPTCVVTSEQFGYFATGPVKNTSTGKIITPEEPSVPPDLRLPPLAP